MACSEIISCYSQLQPSWTEIAPIAISGILMVANIIVLIVMVKTYKKQSTQIEEARTHFNKQFKENQRQFSDRSFQDAFFSLFSLLEDEKQRNTSRLSSSFKSVVEKDLKLNTPNIESLWKKYIGHNYPIPPITKEILHLINLNLRENRLTLDNARYYTGLVASKNGDKFVKEYKLRCVAEFILFRVRSFYDEAIELGYFGCLTKYKSGDFEDEIDKRIDFHINEIIK